MLRIINNLKVHCNLSKTVSFGISRGASTQKIPDLEECVAVSNDGRVFACWHPEKPILYENTKAFPEETGAVESEGAILKNVDMRLLRRKKPDELVRRELMALTYTTKHKWFPRSRDKKFRKFPVEREYL